ncbi:hypothetical protein DCCM_0976 [Desulfocucumis palustris]|uniref:Cytoskeleton protein RodZ-like C-terminal domain-containing protein n=1 Tax=Desulfocucumis palustris TaxID=1898651 RepID=A0A2L2X9Q2_9FIRM|nr:hypothetical protein DCCM_0976 [Desulfocucumis palustris]
MEADIKIRLKYLEALENEDYGVLPGKAYEKGFLKNYAQYLGLNPNEVIAAYLNEQRVEEEPEPDVIEAPPPVKSGNGKRLVLGLLLAGVVLVVGVFAILPSLQEKEPGQSGRQENYVAEKEQTPAPNGNKENIPGESENQAPSAEVQPEGVDITLNVTDRASWMLVVVDGQTQFTGEVAPGQSKSFHGQERIWVKLGNAGDVNVNFNGEDIGVLGQRGDVVAREFTAGTQG